MNPKQASILAKSVETSDEEYLSLVSSVISNQTLLFPFLKGLAGTIRGRSLEAMVREARFLVSQQYETPHEHFVANQSALMVLKYPWDNSPFDPKAAALRKFKAGEEKCRRVNQKIRAWKRVRRFTKSRPHWTAVCRMREWISEVLGPFNLERLQAQCDLSGGASIGVHGNATNLYQKWTSDWTVTRTALTYATQALWSNFHAREIVLPLGESGYRSHDEQVFLQLVHNKCVIVDANKLGFVKKTVESDRTIAVEPLLNSFLQKGVDLVMRQRLKLFGIDLSDQSRNATLAKRGSHGWQSQNPWVTIDLANASGSIAKELVKLLLPRRWWEYLDSIRSYGYHHEGGEWTEYSSFCSMGNGFCFPLESLIFGAFCVAAGCDEFAIYGDDIIVRRGRALYLIELLRYFGFSTNVDKTFVTGPFRESCGSDYFAGEDVRPTVFDEKLNGLPAHFSVHNSTLRNPKTESLFEDFREKIRDKVPHSLRYYGLSGQNPDSYFVVPQDLFMCSPHTKWDRRSDPKGPNINNWRWKAYLAQSVCDPEAVNPPAEVDWYAILRGAIDAGPPRPKGTQERPVLRARPDWLHTLRYTTKRQTKWINAPVGDNPLIRVIDENARMGTSVRRCYTQ